MGDSSIFCMLSYIAFYAHLSYEALNNLGPNYFCVLVIVVFEKFSAARKLPTISPVYIQSTHGLFIIVQIFPVL